MLPKNPAYTFIQTYTFISFQQKFPPICLFSPIFLLIFEEISHLYFYSDSSSIRNSRVGYSLFVVVAAFVKVHNGSTKFCEFGIWEFVKLCGEQLNYYSIVTTIPNRRLSFTSRNAAKMLFILSNTTST